MQIIGIENVNFKRDGKERSFLKVYLTYSSPNVEGLKTCVVSDFNGFFNDFAVGDYVSVIRDDEGRLESVEALL